MLRKLTCIASFFPTALSASGQAVLEASEVEFETSLEKTLSEANERHQGDHLIFLYDDSGTSRDIVRKLFADEDVAVYLNTHFATLAVRIDTPRGNRILNSYAGGGKGPRIIISAQRLDNLVVHKPGGSKAAFLEQLSTVKNATKADEARKALLSPPSVPN